MRQAKVSIGVGAVIVSVAAVIYLYQLSINIMMHKKKLHTTPRHDIVGTPFKHIPLDEVYKDFQKKEDSDYNIDDDQTEPVAMIDTPGCKIPLALVNYRKYKPKNFKNKNVTCGKRAVFLKKYEQDKVIARIKTRKFEQYTQKNTRIQCCYRFIIDAIQNPHERSKLIFSNCTDFQHETIITLQSDFLNILCTEYKTNNSSRLIYDDMYAFAKKIEIPKLETKPCKIKYNVLMLGIDSMSLSRAVQTLPRTAAFLKSNNWLGFRGYHKIADNTLPNLMAVLTGKNMSTIIKKCFGSMDNCQELLIWKEFQKAGYITAYAEDYVQINTFRNNYAFLKQPTNHYMKPLFLKGEKLRNKSLLCAGKVSSGQQVLDYALDFANTYKKDSFFGLFWINSLSHNDENHLKDADKIIENFMNQLTYTGVLINTFVMLFSDHGLRFGSLRLKMESYYDDRMPMNFMWIPLFFKGRQSYELRALAINQYRLLTPYDVYSTLLEIKNISQCGNFSDFAPEGCPKCHSMFDVISSNRTCRDAAIHDKWCSCHKLFPVPIRDPVAIKSVHAVVKHFKTMVHKIETQRCWGCMDVSLKNVTRIHFYYDDDKVSIFYVVAFTMTPGNGTYEATALRKDDQNEYSIIGPISLISTYNVLGQCALNSRERKFCVCQKKDKC